MLVCTAFSSKQRAFLASELLKVFYNYLFYLYKIPVSYSASVIALSCSWSQWIQSLSWAWGGMGCQSIAGHHAFTHSHLGAIHLLACIWQEILVDTERTRGTLHIQKPELRIEQIWSSMITTKHEILVSHINFYKTTVAILNCRKKEKNSNSTSTPFHCFSHLTNHKSFSPS